MSIGNVDGFMNRLISMSNNSKSIKLEETTASEETVNKKINDIVAISQLARSSNEHKNIENSHPLTYKM